MTDFYDIWIFSQSFTFGDDRFARAISATFARRRTEIATDLPGALSLVFPADEQKQQQWRVFVEGVALNPGDLADVAAELVAFLMPQSACAKEGSGADGAF